MPDLSIETSFIFGAIIASKFLTFGADLPLALYGIGAFVTALIGGAIVGLVSSTLTQYARIPHLLSSILTIGLFHGFNQYVLGTANISLSQFVNPLALINIITKNPEFPVLVLSALFCIIGGFFLLRTQLGYSYAVYGYNPKFFANYSISTHYIVITGIVLANALSGLSGYFVAQSSGFVDVHSGHGMALFCITSLILGKAVFFWIKSFSITIPIVGILSYCSIQQILLKVGFNLKYFTMIQSALVLIILINKYRKQGTFKHTIDNLGV